VLSAASSARTLYGLPFLVPLAMLAAAGLETLPRWLDRPLDALGTWGSAAAGTALWIAWIALIAGWQPKFIDGGFAPTIGPVALIAALAITALWVYVLRLEPRLPVRWLAGVTLVWGLLMTLWLPALDYEKSYRGVIADMQQHRPASGCVAARNLTEPQRAVFHYFAGISASGKSDCPLLLVHTSSAEQPAPGGGWKLAWRGTRPGDNKEFFWLFSR